MGARDASRTRALVAGGQINTVAAILTRMTDTRVHVFWTLNISHHIYYIRRC